MSSNKTAKFQVNGIHCGGCANKIKSALFSINESIETNVAVDSGEVTVNFNTESATLSQIKNKIIETGFSVESVELE